MGTVEYRNKKFRVASAFVAALSIIIYGKPFDVYRAVTSPRFYIVLAISFAAALLLVEFVHFTTVKLDARFGWRSMFKERLVLQVFLGVLAPVMIDLILFSIYFDFLGESVFENGFFHIDLPVVAGFLILFSFYYCLHYWMLTDSIYINRQLELAKLNLQSRTENNPEENLLVEHRGEYINLKTANIFYFYRFGKQIKLVTLLGQEYQIKGTISSLSERFSDSGFIQVNRSVIVNFNSLKGYKLGLRRDTLELLFKNRYKDVLREPEDEFLVTKEHIATVKSRFVDL